MTQKLLSITDTLKFRYLRDKDYKKQFCVMFLGLLSSIVIYLFNRNNNLFSFGNLPMFIGLTGYGFLIMKSGKARINLIEISSVHAFFYGLALFLTGLIFTMICLISSFVYGNLEDI